MTTALASLVALALLALPAVAGQRQSTFRVGATVLRSARVDTSGTRVTLAGARAVAVQIDSAAAKVVTVNEVALPDGTRQVTIQY